MKLLDLYCGAGGCSVGYSRAGFEVTGVDIEPQASYPFRFIQANALEFPLEGYDVIHASPPCQLYSQATLFHKGARNNHISHIEPIRERLQQFQGVYVIENIEAAPLMNAIKLCGHMFNLRVYRHRLFESNIALKQPKHRKHILKAADAGRIAKSDEFWCPVGKFGHKYEAAQAMGIDWMHTVKEIAQAIPPAYTEYIGKQIMSQLQDIRSDPSGHEGYSKNSWTSRYINYYVS